MLTNRPDGVAAAFLCWTAGTTHTRLRAGRGASVGALGIPRYDRSFQKARVKTCYSAQTVARYVETLLDRGLAFNCVPFEHVGLSQCAEPGMRDSGLHLGTHLAVLTIPKMPLNFVP